MTCALLVATLHIYYPKLLFAEYLTKKQLSTLFYVSCTWKFIVAKLRKLCAQALAREIDME